ncbi:glycoside hydrolase superfamily [Gautieria morchelliformis]|nr:glycoside hydrolase superfamily [Gautieria morchelliformis]
MLESGFSSPRDSYAAGSQTLETQRSSARLVDTYEADNGIDQDTGEKAFRTDSTKLTKAKKKAKSVPLLVFGGLLVFVVVVAAVILPVYFLVIRPDQHHNSAAAQAAPAPGSTSTPGSNPTPLSNSITGGDGSLVTTSDGSTFTYKNPFGGYWLADPSDPYNNGAKPQSWVPALNESWTFGQDLIHGVNLGGDFYFEPFIIPSLFEKYQTGAIQAQDEWTLSQAMRADASPGGGIGQLEKHYQEFITEVDFAEIAGAGLNWIRLPIPFWAIDTWNDEPFLEGVSWKYILQAFAWARKYGLRIYLDLHTIPGSQNGYNHSGKEGQVNFINGVMGLANAERTLGYIRILAEFISQPEYVDLIPIFGMVNEALLQTIGRENLSSFYLQAYDIVRSITGVGQGKGPFLSIHDGFQGLESWANFLPGSDRIILDTHPYFAFDGSPNTQPLSQYAAMPCNSWASGVNGSQQAFGVTIAGEFSNAVNDCGLWVRGVGGQASYGGDCSTWEDASTWDSSVITGLKQFALTSMDSLQNYFFWTWKVGNSSTTNTVRAPLWSYQLGLQVGAIPSDPREAYGACASVGVAPTVPFAGTYLPWQTGGSGAGTINPSVSSQFVWPPATMAGVTPANQVALLPTYTNTAPVETLPMPTYTFTTGGSTSTITSGNGWLDAQDTQGGVTAVAGCTYPDPWNAVSATLPTAACTGPAAAVPLITPAPTRN